MEEQTEYKTDTDSNEHRDRQSALSDLLCPVPFYEDKWVTLYHGESALIVPQLGNFDLLLADPPYGIGINQSNRLATSRGFKGETWDNQIAPPELMDMLFEKTAKQIVWGGNYYPFGATRGFLVWDKQNDGRDFADCEFAWTSIDKVARIFRRRPMNMDGGKVHPTQKPIALMQWCIEHAGEVQSILDPFGGSGTSGIAGKNLGIKTTLIERELCHCETTVKRLKQETFDFG